MVALALILPVLTGCRQGETAAPGKDFTFTGDEVTVRSDSPVARELVVEPVVASAYESSFRTVVPLKFSSLNRGERAAAEASVSQAEHYLQAARQAVRTDVLQAWNAWQAACEVAEHYSTQIVADARTIRDGIEFSYTRGDALLLELLTAVRTYNDVALSAAEAQAARLAAAAHLQAALGVE